jgi:hypothetical protein
MFQLALLELLGQPPSHGARLPLEESSQTTGAPVAFEPNPEPEIVTVPRWAHCPDTAVMVGPALDSRVATNARAMSATPIVRAQATRMFTSKVRVEYS